MQNHQQEARAGKQQQHGRLKIVTACMISVFNAIHCDRSFSTCE